MHLTVKAALIASVPILIGGCSMINAAKPQTSSKKARVIIDIPASVAIEQVKSALHEAIAYRSSRFKEVENFMPTSLSDEPLAPTSNEMFAGMGAIAGGNPKLESMQFDVSKSYYSVKGDEEIQTPFHQKSMAYVGALYPAKSFNRVYLVVFYEEGSEGISGAITKATADMLIGTKGAIPFIVQVKEKFLDIVPEGQIIQADPSEIATLKLDFANRAVEQ